MHPVTVICGENEWYQCDQSWVGQPGRSWPRIWPVRTRGGKCKFGTHWSDLGPRASPHFWAALITMSACIFTIDCRIRVHSALMRYIQIHTNAEFSTVQPQRAWFGKYLYESPHIDSRIQQGLITIYYYIWGVCEFCASYWKSPLTLIVY